MIELIWFDTNFMLYSPLALLCKYDDSIQFIYFPPFKTTMIFKKYIYESYNKMEYRTTESKSLKMLFPLCKKQKQKQKNKKVQQVNLCDPLAKVAVINLQETPIS